MRFLRRNSKSADEQGISSDSVGESSETDISPRAYTPKKGRPTPSRREAEARRRGPVAPAPKTTREAIRRAREQRKQNPMTKQEVRARRAEQRERMMAGEDAYLLPRDRGPVKAFIRDVVDARRNVLGLFMPLAIVVFISILIPSPAVQQWVTLVLMVMLIGMALEGVLNGRRIAKLVRKHFPDEPIRGASIGWYSFIRASQIRKLRVPRPRVKPGDPVKVPR